MGGTYALGMRWLRRLVRKSKPAPTAAPASGDLPEWTHPDRWRLGEWDQPDLEYVYAHAEAHYRDWELNIPQLELVQCGDKVKPALFFKIGYAEFQDWADYVEPVSCGWNWFQTKGATPYIVIEFEVKFVNPQRRPIGVGGAGQITVTTTASREYAHQLKCRTFLDPADEAHRAAIEAWAAGPAPTMFYFVEERFQGRAYVSKDLGPADKQDLLRVLAEATEELRNDAVVPGSFGAAREFLANNKVRGVTWWKDL